jgi:hypothetical protein
MNFSKLKLNNFKGFADPIQFELRPLTFFYGAKDFDVSFDWEKDFSS